MHIVDVLGIFLFALFAFFLYKKAWFYSLYAFVKFLVIAVLALTIGVFGAAHNPFSLPITTLQQSLILQLALFLLFWKFVNFKRIYFFFSRHFFDIDRFFFLHNLNPVINVVPSFVASLFVTLFLFTALVSQGSSNAFLQAEIEKSTIIRPIAYRIYLTPFGKNEFNLFNGTLFKISEDAYTSTGAQVNQIKESAILAFQQKLDIERIKAGMYTLPAFLQKRIGQPTPGGSTNTSEPPNTQDPNIPYNPPPNDTSNDTSQPNPTQPPYNPPQVTYVPPVFGNPAPTSYPYQPPTATPRPTSPPTQPAPPATDNISSVEQDIFNLTNEQRQQNGVPPLQFDTSIAAVAHAHSTDMNARNFFDHINPDGLDPFQRMQIGGITLTGAGENIAGGQSAAMIMTNWMNSPGHRANILSTSFTRIGVGVSVSSKYGLLATQDFAN